MPDGTLLLGFRDTAVVQEKKTEKKWCSDTDVTSLSYSIVSLHVTTVGWTYLTLSQSIGFGCANLDLHQHRSRTAKESELSQFSGVARKLFGDLTKKKVSITHMHTGA
jgi:hypothetical protein